MALSKKQKEYIHKADSRWNFKVGAVRSGKSYIDTLWTIPYRIRKVHGKPGICAIFGVSNQTIERNVLEPMREQFGKELVGTIKTGVGTAQLFGEDVYCIGAEKVNAVNRVRGLSLKYAYGDEIAGWNPEVFAMIESRLDKAYSKFDGACNPEGPSHWFKKWLDNPKLDAYIQQYVIFDNPFLPRAFVQSLCDEYEGTVYYDRYILGKWALAEGLIYPRYKEAIAKGPGDYEEYAVSIDYGTQNAFCAILWGKRGRVWYALKEYYWSGRDKGVQKTDEEYGNDLDAFVAPVYKGKRLLTIIDPSAASFIALLKKKPWCRVKKAKNDVLDGIREVSSAIYEGRIKIDPDMKNTIDELQGYVWDEKSGEDRPVKVKDHACDAIRYFVFTMLRKKQHGVSVLK